VLNFVTYINVFMSDNVLRHVISLIAMLCAGIIYWAAYVSGANGWWFTMFTLIGVYAIVYKFVDA